MYKYKDFFLTCFLSVPFEPCGHVWHSDSRILSPSHHYDGPVHQHLSGLQEQGLQTQPREEGKERAEVRAVNARKMKNSQGVNIVRVANLIYFS